MMGYWVESGGNRLFLSSTITIIIIDMVDGGAASVQTVWVPSFGRNVRMKVRVVLLVLSGCSLADHPVTFQTTRQPTQ
jgi:hypothetical protein